jgi:hypothetical protein
LPRHHHHHFGANLRLFCKEIYRLKGREGATEGMKPRVILEGFYLMLKFMT